MRSFGLLYTVCLGSLSPTWNLSLVNAACAAQHFHTGLLQKQTPSLNPHNVSCPGGYQLGHPNVRDDIFSNRDGAEIDSDAGSLMESATSNYPCNPQLEWGTDLRRPGKGMRCAKELYIPP